MPESKETASPLSLLTQGCELEALPLLVGASILSESNSITFWIDQIEIIAPYIDVWWKEEEYKRNEPRQSNSHNNELGKTVCFSNLLDEKLCFMYAQCNNTYFDADMENINNSLLQNC